MQVLHWIKFCEITLEPYKSFVLWLHHAAWSKNCSTTPTFAHGYLFSLLKIHQPWIRERLAIWVVKITLVHPLSLPSPYYRDPSNRIHIIAARVKWWFCQRDVIAKEYCRKGFDIVCCNGDIREKLAKETLLLVAWVRAEELPVTWSDRARNSTFWANGYWFAMEAKRVCA